MKITAKIIIKAVKDGLEIDSEYSAETKRGKRLVYHPLTGILTIYTIDEGGSNDFSGEYPSKGVKDAIDNYNSYDVEG